MWSVKYFFFNNSDDTVDELPHILMAKVWKRVQERFVERGIDNPVTECALRPIK